MKMRVAIAAVIGCVSSLALAADTLSIDSVAGVYKTRGANIPERTPPTPENILEIVKISPVRAYVRAHLEARNGDICGLWGVADVKGDALVYSRRGNCTLTLQFANGQVTLHDTGRECQKQFCGLTGVFEGIRFPVAARRSIGYMQRLLASRQYGAAIRERNTGRPQ